MLVDLATCFSSEEGHGGAEGDVAGIGFYVAECKGREKEVGRGVSSGREKERRDGRGRKRTTASILRNRRLFVISLVSSGGPRGKSEKEKNEPIHQALSFFAFFHISSSDAREIFSLQTPAIHNI